MKAAEINIGELGRVVTGKTPSTKNAAFFGGDHQFVTPSDLDWKTYYCQSTERTVTEDARLSHNSQFIPADAIMVTCIGNTIGKCGISSAPCLTNQQINSIIPYEGHDPRFVYYLLIHNVEAVRGVGIGGGSATPIVNKTTFSRIKLRVPPKNEWNSIATVLSAYDDLIENNRRRIQLLEQAARLLYKEWFVHLRFPGHEHVKIKDGVPEGWEIKRLADLTTKIGSGATPRGGSGSYKTEGITLIRSLNVYDYRVDENGLVFIDDEQAKKLSNVTVEPYDILLNITGASVARCCMVRERHLPARVNQHVMIIRVNPAAIGAHYLLCSINSEQRKQLILNIARAGGATREALTKDVVSGLKITVPKRNILDIFEEVAGDFSKQMQVLEHQNSHLAKARELLLPRLMNGEVAV